MAALLRPLRRLPRSKRASYHSYTHPPPPSPFSPLESSILLAATPHISSHGFTPTTLALGARSAGYVDATMNLFPAGAFSLVHWHLHTQRLELSKHNAELPQSGIGARVKALTWARLLGNKDVIHKWQEALALMSLPTNIPLSVRELSLLSDEIWFLASDTAVDTSWYTKRLSLAGIYAAAELFMTTDNSVGFESTKEFLDRRFEDSRNVGTLVRGMGQWVGFTAGAGINVLRSKGVRI